MPEQKPLILKVPEQDKKEKKDGPIKWEYVAGGLAAAVGIGLDMLDGELDLFDLLDSDYDNDGLSNQIETMYGLDPRNDDSDGDDIKDAMEGFYVTERNPQTGVREQVWYPHYTFNQEKLTAKIDGLLKDSNSEDGGSYFSLPYGYERGFGYLKPGEILPPQSEQQEGGDEGTTTESGGEENGESTP